MSRSEVSFHAALLAPCVICQASSFLSSNSAWSTDSLFLRASPKEIVF